jgi:hypothetical protein
VSEERERLSKGETGGEREKLSDVEAHKMSRLSEADEKRDKIAEADDEADVEGHVLSPKMNTKMDT